MPPAPSCWHCSHPPRRRRPAAFPDLTYTVTLNLGTLDINPSDTFSLDLQFITGSGNVTNTVKLSNFQFLGGSADSTPEFTSGGVAARSPRVSR